MCIAGKEGSALGRNVCARRLATFRQKATHGGFNVREENTSRWGKKGEKVDTYETLHSSAGKEAHLIRVQGTNYFPILWPAKI